MAATTLKDFQELPGIMTIKHLQDALGISRPKAYELAHTQGFPVIRLGKVLRVPKDAFLRWLEKQSGEQAEA